jgi:hypothetical protein
MYYFYERIHQKEPKTEQADNTHWKHTNAIYGDIEMLKVALHLLVRKKRTRIVCSSIIISAILTDP